MYKASKGKNQRAVNEKRVRDEEEGYDSDQKHYKPRLGYQGPRLRHKNIPYSYEIPDAMFYERLDTSRRIGLFKPLTALLGSGGEVRFENVRYVGGYTWLEPIMRDQLGVYRGTGERVMSTPAIPDILGDPSTIGRLDSDFRSGFIDYVIGAKDASFLRPTFSPFEPIFHSLSATPIPKPKIDRECDPERHILDDTDVTTDHTTLYLVCKFHQDPNTVMRIDCQPADPLASGGAVLMHNWIPKIWHGPGAPHRGWVNSYTRRITQSRSHERQGNWMGGMMQVVKYDLGGIGCIVKYPIRAMLGDSSNGIDKLVDGDQGVISMKSDIDLQYAQADIRYRVCFDTSKHTTTTTTDPIASDNMSYIPTDVDHIRDKFTWIKVYSLNQHLDLQEPYLHLVLSQTYQCLIAPYFRGDFNQPAKIVSISDPLFDEARKAMTPLLNQAVGLIKGMIGLSRRYGQISFVGNDEGSVEVFGLDKGRYVEIGGDNGLSDYALGILRASRTEVQRKDGQIHYHYQFQSQSQSQTQERIGGPEFVHMEYDYTKKDGNWAELCHASDPLVARW